MRGREALALDPRGRRRADGERLDRLPEALQLEAAERFGLDDLLDLRQDPLADSDLARRRGVAKARGEVEDAADGAVVVATLEADPADRRVAERHTEREVELVPALPPPRRKLAGQLGHRALDRLRAGRRGADCEA